MVKKSLLTRLFDRWKNNTSGTGGPDRNIGGRSTLGENRFEGKTSEQGERNGQRSQGSSKNMSAEFSQQKASVETIPVERVGDQPGKSESDKRSEKKDVKSSKLAPQEELSLKISEGINKLSSLLGNIDNKLASQNQQGQEIARRLDTLPRVLESLADTQKTNLEVAREVKEAIKNQAETSKQTAQSVDKLPGLMEGIGDKIEQQAKTGATVKDSVEGVGKSVRGLADSSQRAQNTMLAEFRRAQDEHRRRLQDVVQRERITAIIVSVIGLLVVGGLIVLVARG